MALYKLLDFALQIRAVGFKGAAAAIQGVNRNLEKTKGLAETVSRTRAAVEGLASAGVLLGAGEMARGFIEAASSMQEAQARLAAATGLSSNFIAELKEHAESFSETNFGATAEGYIGTFQTLYQNLHSTKAAMAATDYTFKAAEATGASYAAVVGLVNAAHENFRAPAQQVAQVLAATQRQFTLGTDDMDGFTHSIARMAGAAKLTNTSLSQLAALAGEANQLLPGGRGAQLMASLISELPAIAAKNGISVQNGLIGVIDQIHARTNGLSGAALQGALGAMGLKGRIGAELMPLLDNIEKVKSAAASIQSGGAKDLASALASASSTYPAQMADFSHAMANLRDTLGGVLLPELTKFAKSMTDIASATRSFLEHHENVKKMALGLGAIAALGAALSVVGSAIAFIGGGLAFIPAAATAASTSIGFLTTMMEGLSVASLAFNPIAWAALAVGAAVLIYEYWGPIKSFFEGLWTGIKSTFENFDTWTRGWAATFGKILLIGLTGPFGMIAIEIYRHWGEIKKACESVAGGILGYFKGNSPPPLGPLHNLNKVDLVETIAETIRPAAALGALKRTAAAIAVAMPLIFAPVAASASPGPRGGNPRRIPTSLAERRRGASSAASAPIIVVNLTQEIKLSGKTSDQDLKELADKLARDMYDALEREQARRDRKKL
jgi:hypothetical protein